MKVLSYYSIKNGDVKKEHLIEHVQVMINLLSNFEETRAYKFGGLLCRSLNLNPVDFKSSLVQAVVLHDVGKAFYRQHLPKHIKEGHLSFPGHEVISAVITWYAMERLVIKQVSPFSSFMKPVVFSILYHHHAMDIKKRLNSVRRLRNLSDAVNDLKEYLEELGNFIPKALINKLVEVLEEIEKENCWILVRKIRRKFEGEIEGKIWKTFISSDVKSQVQKKLSLLMLSCLISLDYIAASKLRDLNISTTFGKIIEEFYKIYCYLPS